ncbi:MAG TPA: SpoIVB peptidase S55 domain-containing protein [Opitutales bacterium]|nr:SpoIVB peptidase S55 domain-containing protein [Opitutales bacterium]
MRSWRKLIYLLLATAGICSGARGADVAQTAENTLPLADVKPGMKGEWRTAVQGTTVQSFPLEVLGVMENFSGPKRSIIICQALDPGQMQNGPVAGMSGSPVYIDGKLVGAYAYGFTYSKDQAIIGVTPIADMMEVLNQPGPQSLPGRPREGRVMPMVNDIDKNSAPANGSATAALSNPPDSSNWRVTLGADRLGGRDLNSLLKPLPTPLMASGISARTLAAFKEVLAKRGLELVAAPGGRAPGGGPPASALEPGSPMAIVLLSGDFSISGVGTLTWRQGDKVIAFGHPMFDDGAVDLPLATADVVTVVRAYDRSFKLANVGPIIGTISQDRLTGIGGAIGPKPAMTAFHSRVTGTDGVTRTFQGDLWQDRDLSPTIGAMGLLESLNSTEQTAQEQTFYINATLDIEGFPPLKLTQVVSGADGATVAAMDFLDQYDQLMGNPFETPHVRSLDFDVKLRDTWLMSGIESVRVDSGPLRAGGKLAVTLTLSNYRDAPTEKKIAIPIPESMAGESVTLFVGDADAADAIDRGFSRRDFTSLADVVKYIGQSRNRGAVYVKLLHPQSGLRVEGDSLPGLPPSVEALYNSPKNITPGNVTTQVTLWETSLPVPGEFSGRYTMPLKVLP